MFNWPLRFFMEAYLEICFASWMKWIEDDLSYESKTDSIDTVLAWFYLVISCLVPIVLIIFLASWEAKLQFKPNT